MKTTAAPRGGTTTRQGDEMNATNNFCTCGAWEPLATTGPRNVAHADECLLVVKAYAPDARRLTGPNVPAMTLEQFSDLVLDHTHGDAEADFLAWCRVVRAAAVARGTDRHTAALRGLRGMFEQSFFDCSPIVDVLGMIDCEATGYTGGYTPGVVDPALTRGDLIQWLCHNDRNGCYSDADGAAEGFDPLTYADAYRLVLDALGAS